MTLSTCTQRLWSTMVRPVLSGTCPVKPLYGLGHRAAAQFQGESDNIKYLNPIEHLWGILKWKVEEFKVSNIHQLCDIIMEEWKRTPVATFEAQVNSMPKRVKTVLENNGGHTKY
ncbi:unnamed protein product [Staurois parvus]|uniref:Tc1-like transposase DDE domain-containing protein n=1 Tax=Staurois parvus TaxID=386267 RepID=A0ABN9HFA8_9NEOB|nr:unnamed protein product [Staurois parvus]